MAEFLTQSLFFSLSTKYFSSKYFLTISLNISMFSRTWYHKWIFSLISIPKMYVFMHIGHVGVKVPKLQRLILLHDFTVNTSPKGKCTEGMKSNVSFPFSGSTCTCNCVWDACMHDGWLQGSICPANNGISWYSPFSLCVCIRLYILLISKSLPSSKSINPTFPDFTLISQFWLAVYMW